MTAQVAIPAQTRPAHDTIVSLIDRFCQVNLTPEYQTLCRELAAVLARKRPSPLLRGKPEVWACAVIRVIGWVNFLDGGNEKPHMKLTAIDKVFGVAESTAQGKAKAIRDMLRIRSFDADWTLPSQMHRLPKPLTIPMGLLVIHRNLDDTENETGEHQAFLIRQPPSPKG